MLEFSLGLLLMSLIVCLTISSGSPDERAWRGSCLANSSCTQSIRQRDSRPWHDRVHRAWELLAMGTEASVGCWNGVRRVFLCGVIFAAKPLFGKAIIKETMQLHNKAPQGFESDMTKQLVIVSLILQKMLSVPQFTGKFARPYVRV
jgi:hypothetical protein